MNTFVLVFYEGVQKVLMIFISSPGLFSDFPSDEKMKRSRTQAEHRRYQDLTRK